MRTVENKTEKQSTPEKEKAMTRKFENVKEKTDIVLKEAVKVISENGDEFLLEEGDTLQFIPKESN